MPRLLIVTEKYWPEGGGGTLATHLILRLLRQSGNPEMTVLTGTKAPSKLAGVQYVTTPSLSAGNKIQLWSNLVAVTAQPWFLRLVNDSDIVYIPRYCYPVIPIAKKLGKKVVVHLHDYQPISYNGVVFHESVNLPPGAARGEAFYELREHGSSSRAAAGALLTTLNALIKKWVMLADHVICVSRRQGDIIKQGMPEISNKLEVI